MTGNGSSRTTQASKLEVRRHFQQVRCNGQPFLAAKMMFLISVLAVRK
jgi:hypothetical protein